LSQNQLAHLIQLLALQQLTNTPGTLNRDSKCGLLANMLQQCKDRSNPIIWGVLLLLPVVVVVVVLLLLQHLLPYSSCLLAHPAVKRSCGLGPAADGAPVSLPAPCLRFIPASRLSCAALGVF